MKRIAHGITAMMMALTLVFCTLLQFHHHDRMGNIFITLSFIGEIELGVHQHEPGHCCHHHHQGSEPGDCGDSDNCAMHIDVPLSGSDYHNNQANAIPQPVCIDAILPVPTDIPVEGILYLTTADAMISVAKTVNSKTAVRILRGPPCA